MSVERDGWTELIARGELARSTTRVHPKFDFIDGNATRAVDVVDRMLLGSSPDAALSLQDRSVSRLHAQLEIRGDDVWIRDLGSRNGTYVEGVRVEQALVPPGGRVVVGKTTLVLAIAEKADRVALWPHDRFGPMVGRSEAMREFFMCLSRFATSDATVLVQGETGTGKELVALALHEASDRSEGPFVVVDCGALPEALLESELFGHARGAFSGAVAARAGAIEIANGGTVFLDEIGELPLSMQPKLLRALEAKTVRRIGESEHRPIDVRFVAATHRDLQSMVTAGAFREDLFFRLAVLPAYTPPLRARPDDIPALLAHFLEGRHEAPSGALLEELCAYPWMGNVRELRNFAERMVVLGVDAAWAITRGAEATRDRVVGESTLRAPSTATFTAAADLPPANIEIPFKELRERWLDHLERSYMTSLIAVHARNVSAIAEAAGLDRTYVHRLLRKHDL